MPPVAARSSQVVNKIISPGAEKTRGDACDVREMWAAAESPVDELILSFRQKSFIVKLELGLHTKKILSGAKNYPDFQEFFVPQNKAKNAGMREIGWNAGFPARLRDGWHLCVLQILARNLTRFNKIAI